MAEAAFFDLDKTIIAKSSVLAFGRPFYREGLLSRRAIVKSMYAQIVYMLVGADESKMEEVREAMLSLTKGWQQEHVAQIVAETLDEVISPIVFAEALELFDEHHDADRKVVIVSSSPAEVVNPLGTYLGADEVIATPRPHRRRRCLYGGARVLCVRAAQGRRDHRVRRHPRRRSLRVVRLLRLGHRRPDARSGGASGRGEPRQGPRARGDRARLGDPPLRASGPAARSRASAAQGTDDRGRHGDGRRRRRGRRLRVVASPRGPRLVTPADPSVEP